MREASFFPYPYRPHQKDIVDKTLKALEQKYHLVMESGTGTGKTITTVTPSVEFALKNGLKVIYTTHTNSQQVQVITESRKLKEMMAGAFKFFAIGVQGRSSMCMLGRDEPDIPDGTPEELSRLCSDRKRKTQDRMAAIAMGPPDSPADPAMDEFIQAKGCPYFARLLAGGEEVEEIKDWALEYLPTAEELFRKCQANRVCPYEMTRMLLKHADLVVLPYIWAFQPFMRQRLFEMMGASADSCILIVDEAHNLPDYARDLASFHLTLGTIEHVYKEAQDYGDKRLGDTTTVAGLAEGVSKAFFALRNEYIVEPMQEDALVPSGDLNTDIMSALSCTSTRLDRVIADAKAFGEMVRNEKRDQGKLMRSYAYSMSVFLMNWEDVSDGPYVRLIDISQGEERPELEAFCLDPSEITKIVDEHWATIHMSGTLQPMDEYVASIGFKRKVEVEEFPSPFPKNNLLRLCVEDVTTKYDDMRTDKEMFPRLFDRLVEVLDASEKSSAVFFSSYSMMDRMLESGLESFVGFGRQVYTDGRGLDQRKLMDAVNVFKKDKFAPVLMSVMGGRVSEGLDFPGDALEVVVIVGIPYPKPTAKQQSLQLYYDRKFGRGWEFTVSAPAVRRMLQAIGRIQRTETDRGVAVILDRRAMPLKRYLGMLEPTMEPGAQLKEFFENPTAHTIEVPDEFVSAEKLYSPQTHGYQDDNQ